MVVRRRMCLSRLCGELHLTLPMLIWYEVFIDPPNLRVARIAIVKVVRSKMRSGV